MTRTLLACAISIAVMFGEYQADHFAAATGRTAWSLKYIVLLIAIVAAVRSTPAAPRFRQFIQRFVRGVWISVAIAVATGSFAYVYSTQVRPTLYSEVLDLERAALLNARSSAEETEFRMETVARKYTPLGQMGSLLRGNIVLGIILSASISGTLSLRSPKPASYS
jgi:hypothetical protein